MQHIIWKINDRAMYKGQTVKLVKTASPQDGFQLVTVERESDKQRMTVQIRRLTPLGPVFARFF